MSPEHESPDPEPAEARTDADNFDLALDVGTADDGALDDGALDDTNSDTLVTRRASGPEITRQSW